MASKMFILVTFLSLLSFSQPSLAVDPSPLQDFCVADLNSGIYLNGFPCKNPAKVSSEDFFFEGFVKRGRIYNAYDVNITEGSVFTFPGLNTLGMSMNRIQFLPGGLNPPHIHPRSSELSVVVEGKIIAGWISTEYILYWKVLGAGELFVIPPGVVHFQLNVGEGNAQFYASFNSQNPGISRIAPALFNSMPLVPDEVLSKAFNVNSTIIEFIKSRIAELGNPDD